MPKFGAYYSLCPLIDHRSLLGVSEDESFDYIVVTLGKNIAIKYKVSDQKQTHSWSTKERLTSLIIYDKSFDQYVAVFNNLAIRMFGSDCENLDRIKKYKFKQLIHCLMRAEDGEVIILYKNGSISSLKCALHSRKNDCKDKILNDDDSIEQYSIVSFQNETIVGILVKDRRGNLEYVLIPLVNDKSKENQDGIRRIKLERSNLLCVNSLLIANENLKLLTLWSDGKLYSYNLDEKSKFPGQFLSVIDAIMCDQPVSVCVLSYTHIAMYGLDKNRDGASLLIYNVQYHIIQSMTSFKLFTSGSQLYAINDKILLPVGNNLAVVPFSLETEYLSALIGSHRTYLKELDPDISIVTEIENADWGEGKIDFPTSFEGLPTAVKKMIVSSFQEGSTEYQVCKEIITNLIEKKDLENLINVLKIFKHVSEDIIISLLQFILESNVKSEKSECLRKQLLSNIILLPFNETILLPYLRNELVFSKTLQLLTYLCELIEDDSNIDLNCKIFEWSCLLLDGHYQKFLLSCDEEVIDILKKIQKFVNDEIDCITEFETVIPMIESLKKGKSPIKRNVNNNSQLYSIEQIQLY